ncbi:MAG: hypothetical protein M9938_07475 [Solirubrobacterales bacterium]|nr:hypothetical protein [Solirubrobacterales bacterium]
MLPVTPSLRAAFSSRFLSAAILAMAAVLISISLAGPADAASVRRVDLGAENLARLNPNCGLDFRRDCTAEGRVTMFQSKSKGTAGRTSEVPFNGKLVAWSISLADVTSETVTVDGQEHGAQQPFFDSVFGSPASARIAVLRRVDRKAKGAPRYRLARQSPVQVLNPYFGRTVTFVLDRPLTVIKGQMIGLTIPTWAPALWKPRACNAVYDTMLDPDRCEALYGVYSSRTSRTPRGEDKCTLRRDPATQAPNEALEKTRPQTGIDSIRPYGCYYGPQVALYSATIVAPG